MMRRTGFRRMERIKEVCPPTSRGRAVPMAVINDSVAAIPKRTYIRSKALLAAVRTLPCMHTGMEGQTEPAHSNWAEHGKGRGIKADDNRVAALSAAVHRELDQGKNWTAQERRDIWWAAHVKTVKALLAAGLWPADVPVPDIRNFH